MMAKNHNVSTNNSHEIAKPIQRRTLVMNSASENSQLNIKFINKSCEHNEDTLIFLKSNYKYKRRCEMQTLPFAKEGMHDRITNEICNCNENIIDGGTFATTKRRRRRRRRRNEDCDKFTFSIIQRLFIVFVGNLRQRKLHESVAAGADLAGDVNVDSDEINYQRNYDKVSASRCQNGLLHGRRRHWPSSSSKLRRHRSSSNSTLGDFSTMSTTTSSMWHSPFNDGASSGRQLNVLSILMTLFMALALSVRCVAAGACWQTPPDNAKCSEIFSLNITKSECCRTSHEFSYTDRELTSVEYFFATAIGGGMECAPCIESCKNVKCGPNKKCVKRKGRPKCICAPECGAHRRRQREKLYREFEHHSDEGMLRAFGGQTETHGSAAAAVVFGKSPRDIRSLSSEITNVNLGLEGAIPMYHPNQNQRKLLIMQSQRSQQKPQINKREPKPRRLLITANVHESAEKPTTRRLQILSNVGIHKTGNGRRRKNDDLARTSAETGRGSAVSRQKSNNNNHNKNKNNNELELTKNPQQQQQLQQAGEINNNNNDRVRHIHQHQNRHFENGPNHDEVEDKQHHHERQQQIQRKRKHHNRSKQKQQQQQKLKDQQNNNNNRTVQSSSALIPTSSQSLLLSSSSSSSSPVYNATITSAAAITTTTTNTTTTRLQTLTTPVNSTTSADGRSLNHGSNSATSSSSASSSLSASSSPSSQPSSVGGGGVHPDRTASSSSVNSNDLTFLDGIYDQFNLHGFPNQQHTVTQFEHMHNSHPVCGTDGRTYNTECQLRKRSCRTENPNLQVAYRGHCKTTCNGVKCLNGLTCVEDHYTIPHCIACKIVCPRDDGDDDHDDGNGNDDRHRRRRTNVIDPSRAVCGVDGKTYKSICDINRMICKIGRAIAVAYPGPCRADRITCSDISCGPKHTCLVTLLTHEPRCVSCRYKCSRKRRPTSPRYEEGKICGVNNRTYNSWCEMRKDSCATGFFIDVKSAGECI